MNKKGLAFAAYHSIVVRIIVVHIIATLIDYAVLLTVVILN
ncbi:hypothetical protein [Sporomusa carbonis]